MSLTDNSIYRVSNIEIYLDVGNFRGFVCGVQEFVDLAVRNKKAYITVPVSRSLRRQFNVHKFEKYFFFVDDKRNYRILVKIVQ